jgi:hypothetical protein
VLEVSRSGFAPLTHGRGEITDRAGAGRR